ncbi:MAG: aminopeptidase P family protein [Gemmatimonadaceae bacterium]
MRSRFLSRRLALTCGILCVGATIGHAQIPSSEYAQRRDSLAARIGDGVVVAFGGRTPVTDYGTFFQLPAFHYLTAYDEPDAAFVLVARRGRGVGTLFVTPVDPRRAFYYGFRPDSSAIARSLNLPSRPFATLASYVDSLVTAGAPLFTLADFEDADFARVDSLTRGQQFVRGLLARHPGVDVKDAHAALDQLRARKSPAEVALLKRAAEISAEGHRVVMQSAAPQHEYEIAALIEYTFKRLGAERAAYGSIVGAGVNGTQLHYMKDTAAAHPGDLVVIDAAAEYRGYAADITRTLPVSGTFTPVQRAIYQLVRDAQAAAERVAKPGVAARMAEDSSFAVRARGLASLGLIDSVNATIDPPWSAMCATTPRACTQAYLWTIHGISHGLGLAVHDPAQFYYGDRTYQPGDAFTIEPGIYISSRSLAALPDTPRNRAYIARVKPIVARYENTGVRIEDDYVVTQTGIERISSGAPREIAEIEALAKTRATRTVP